MNILVKYVPAAYKADWDYNGVWAVYVNLSKHSFMFVFHAKPTARQIRSTVKQAKRLVGRYTIL